MIQPSLSDYYDVFIGFFNKTQPPLKYIKKQILNIKFNNN